MSKKRSNSFHKPAVPPNNPKKSELNLGKKRPLQIIADPHQQNIVKQKPKSKAHKEVPIKKSVKLADHSPKKKKNVSPKKSSSGKKHHKSKQYDSPSKQQQEMDYLVIARSHKNTKRDKKYNAQLEALLNTVNDKLKKNKILQAISLLLEIKSKDQNNYDVNYLLGICYLVSGEYPNAALIFKSLISIPKPKKDVFLMQSVCYKKLEDYGSAESTLNTCIQKFPKYYEAYVYRGRLYIKLKMFKQANEDFQQAIYLHPEKPIGYMGKGDCLRSTQNYEEAIALYNTALQIKYDSSVLLRRAICCLELEKWNFAMADIERLLQDDPESSEVLYFKGLIYTKKRNYNEAIICYQQAIKYESNKKAVARSIYEIAKIKIQQRDYYEAFYTLSRAQYLDIQIKSLQKFKIFTDGVTSLMKKNYQKGIETLNQLYKEHNLTKFLKPLFYSSRAYGLMCLDRFEEARADFLRLEKQTSLDNANLYNKFICEGILSCRNQKYEQSLKYFSKAQKILPKRLEPSFYKAATLIKFTNKLIPKNLIQKKREYLSSALKTALKNPTITQNNAGLFLIRGLLYFSLGDTHEALKDITTSIQDSITQKAINFYLKGLALGELHRFQEALSEFNTAIQHDQKSHQFPEIYLNRAKCHLLLGQANYAFNDLQNYMSYRSTSPDIHIWAGHTLFHVGSYEDAARTYSNISNIKKNPLVLQYRAACYFANKNLTLVLQDLKSILNVEQNPLVLFDFKMVQILTIYQQKQQTYGDLIQMMKKFKREIKMFGKIFTKSDYYFYKAIFYTHIPNYQKATKNFQKALEIKETDLNLDTLIEQQEIGSSYDKRTFTNSQCHFNIAVCQALNGNIPKAIKSLELAKKQMPKDKNIVHIENFIQMLQTQKKMLFARPPESRGQQKIVEVIPFPIQNRLCSIFPELTIPLTKTKIKTRLFFCLPEVKKPDVVPHLDDKTLETVDTNWIETRPQAPWIKRNQQGVIFTDELVCYQIQISQSSQEQQQQQDQNQSETREQHQQDESATLDQHQQAMYLNQHSQDSPRRQRVIPPNPRDFARMMKLDEQTEARLARLMQH